MKIDFEKTIKINIIDLIQDIHDSYRELDAQSIIDDFENLSLKITDNPRFQCEIVFNNTILLSETTIEMLWSITYAHIEYYNIFCKNIKPNGQTLNLKHSDWDIGKQMLENTVSSLTRNIDLILPKNSPRPIFSNTEIGLVFKYTLLFFISHELFHVVNFNKFENLIDEENQCDIDAIQLLLKSSEDSNYLNKAKGICYGLMVLNVYGIHTKNYDGKTHPYTYDRLIGNLELFFNKENDNIWGPAVAMFALHMTENNIEQPNEEFENFYDCILKYKEILEIV